LSSAASNPKIRWLAWTALGLVLAAVAGLFVRTQFRRSSLPRLSQVQPFTLTNELGQVVTDQSLHGKVWVGDIIFTRCGGPCPKMTEEISKLQNAISAAPSLQFVTLTTDPEYDSPAILKAYGQKFGADFSRWIFLTGAKAQIKNLASDSLKLAAVEKAPAERDSDIDLFIHSTIFVLVDKSGAMRGVYQSLEPGFQERIRADIQSLLQEN
jgi:protein SCO1/2